MDKKSIIFNCSRRDWKYKGILFAELDNGEICSAMNVLMPAPEGYVAGVMALIWVDENDKWNAKMRIKFPSGNKQVVTLDIDSYKESNIDEEFLIHQFKQLPMVNSKWYPNEDGTPEGLIRIMEETDMIERREIYEEKEVMNTNV